MIKTSLRQFLQPRFLLLVWGGLGGVWLAFVLISAMVPQNGRPVSSGEAIRIEKLAVGPMGRFEPAFPARKAPLNRFLSPTGKTALKDFRGRTVLVNLWATWCAPCVEEMPALDTLQATLGSERFAVVAIAAGPQGQVPVSEFFARHNITHLTAYEDPTLDFAGNLSAAGSFPLSILYDAKGNEVGRLSGAADWTSQEAKALINMVIEGRVQP